MLSKFADYKPKLQNPRRRTVPVFQHVCDDWWEKKSKTLALGSLKSYVPCVARAVDVYSGYRMNEILPGRVAALLNDMKDAGFSQKVISNQLSTVSGTAQGVHTAGAPNRQGSSVERYGCFRRPNTICRR